MKINFCTLFDSNYLDKGIALAHSLECVSKDYELYIYAFDYEAYRVLSDLALNRVKVILFEDIISEELLRIRKERTRAEFCWTCTPYIIEYTLKHFDIEMCTYVDADLYFFKDPHILIDEMIKMNCSVQIVEHRFPDNKKYRWIEKGSGKYCVEFNSFMNDEKGVYILKWWKNQCITCCTSDWSQGSFGDQKYLEDWTERFEGVNVLLNHGGGVAPWNVGRYKLVDNCAEENICFKEIKSGVKYNLIFYHFHDLHFVEKRCVDINIYTRHHNIDTRFINTIYRRYISELIEIRQMLEKKYSLLLPIVKQSNEKILWGKDESLTPIQKIKKVILAPINLYREKILRKRDIIKINC